VVFHVSACASPLRFPTRTWSSHLMVVVRLIRSGLRLRFSDVLRSSIQRSISFSCEKQTGRLDHLPGSGLCCGSLLTGRWFVRLPSDELDMTLYSESLQVGKRKLSTGSPLSGGKLLLIWWITYKFRIWSGFAGFCPLVRPCSWEGMEEGPDLWTNPGAAIGRRMRQPGL
jgi:hypothetical protein